MKQAVICVSSSDVGDLFRKVIKAMEGAEVSIFTEPKGCIQSLEQTPADLLVLDWGMGEAEALEVLEYVQHEHPAGILPTFLFDRGDNPLLNGVAIEYGVTLASTGELTKAVIESRMKTLLATKHFDVETRKQLTLVTAARRTDDIANEISALKSIHDQHASDLNITCELADAYFRAGDIDAATYLLKMHISPEVKHPRLLSIFGRCLMKKGDYDQASVYLQQADLINPFEVDRLVELGEAYLQLDKPSRAQQKFKRALAIDQDSEAAQQGMGKSMLLSGEINDALQFLRQITAPGDLASIFNAAAVIAIRNSRLEQGLKLYRIACKTIGIANKSVLSKLALNMGLAYHKNQHLPHALHYFSIAQQLDQGFERASKAVAALSAKVADSDRHPIGEDLLVELVRDIDASTDTGLGEEDIGSDDATNYVDSF